MTVRVERDGAVTWLRMARPERHNAFDAPMVADFRAAVASIRADPTVRAVVLAGDGPSFSTGVDVKELDADAIGIEWFRDWHHMIVELEQLDVPVIAAIQGHCLGGGLMLTLAVDYRLAADDLRIGLGAVRLGILPGTAPWRLPRVVGPAAARRLSLFGEYVDATEAERIGLVDRVVPAAALDTESRALAARVESFRHDTLVELKRLLRVAPDLSGDDYLAVYLEAQDRCLRR